MKWGALVGAILVGVLLGWLGRDGALAPDLTSWLGDTSKVVVGTVLGALVGALGGYIVASQNRREASRTRFHNDLRQVATDLFQAAERHTKQRRAQFTRWMEVANDASLKASTIPTVEDTEPIYNAASPWSS